MLHRETKPFARRYRKEAIVESQGDGDFPPPWGGTTGKEETLGDVFAEMVGDTMALGLRNHEGPPSVQAYNTTEIIRARAGKQTPKCMIDNTRNAQRTSEPRRRG